MVKCPRRIPAQIKANLANTQRRSFFSLDDSFSWVYDPAVGHMVYVGEKPQNLPEEPSEGELDSVQADKRSPPTARDDLVYYFISHFLDILLESWEGKPCRKAKLGAGSQSEVFGEMEIVPCDDSSASSTAEYLKELYQKRSSNLSKEKSSQKLRKSTDSNETECLNEEDFEEPEPPDSLKAFVPDEEVHFVLLNHVWYKGRVSRRLMDGEGLYFWEDGSTFQGGFASGCATGSGRLEFPDLSVYEGGVYKAFRHGEGMFCFADSPVMYTGQWWLGKKHGYGLIVYNDPSKGLNFYRGQWQNGVKEGFGFRQYPSGGKYIGFWSNGMRHGKGIMLWSNHDIYRGEWKEGLMHGYGEYTWNGFINKSLSYPATNTYRGWWEEGKRNGQGFFELKNGSIIETVWVDNLKEGPGAVVCCNGTIVAAESLFLRDKQALLSNQEDNAGLLFRNQPQLKLPQTKRKEDHLLSHFRNIEKAKSVSIPIHLPVHSLNLYPHTKKLYEKKREELLREKETPSSDFQMIREVPKEDLRDPEILLTNLSDEDHCQLLECVKEEEKHLRNSILTQMKRLRVCYNYYATLACGKPSSFKCIMLRMFLWQMLIDGDVPDSSLSLVDIDNLLEKEEYLLVENTHDPFERIQFWQFLHIMIVLSWHLYGQFVFDIDPLVQNERVADFLQYYRGLEYKSILKSAFAYFLDKDIFHGRFQGKDPEDGESKFQDSDLAPMEAMYNIYRQIGEPHSAREFVKAMCQQTGTTDSDTVFGYIEKLPSYQLEGKNALLVAGELSHIPGPEPFNFPQMLGLEERAVQEDEKSRLVCFKVLGAKRVMRCLMEICPGIMSDEFIVNMDYQLTFLEFYKTVILCTELMLKMKVMNAIRDDILKEHKARMEEYEKNMSEYEKMKEGAVVSRKKSRQFSGYSKKGIK